MFVGLATALRSADAVFYYRIALATRPCGVLICLLGCWAVVGSVPKWATALRAAERFSDNRYFFFLLDDGLHGDAVMETDGIAAVGNGHSGGGFGTIQEG